MLAEVERLSDILCPSDGRLLLIQAKRTLDAKALKEAVKEAYLITDFCRSEIPDILPYLRLLQLIARILQSSQSLPLILLKSGAVIVVSAIQSSGKENVGKENRGFVIFLSYIFLSAGRNDDHGQIRR